METIEASDIGGLGDLADLGEGLGRDSKVLFLFVTILSSFFCHENQWESMGINGDQWG